MNSLRAAELLKAWEYGLDQPLLQRALILLTAACPDLDSAAVAKFSIGVRDAHLLQLREWMFGPLLINTAQCPQCGEKVEWQSKTSELRIQTASETDSTDNFKLKIGHYRFCFRLINSIDIAAVTAKQTAGNNANLELLRRCVVSVDRSGKPCVLDDLPQDTLDGLSQQIEQLDPQADIRTTLTCPQCNYQWQVLFDIASYLWTEVNNWAESTLRTVHRLASAYGWSESEILTLSPVRRQLYLAMVNP